MTTVKRVPSRFLTAIFNSVGAGVTPRVGLEHLVVGREGEIKALLRDLENIEQGGASFRIISGRFGSGKSFLLQLMRNYAMDQNFIVADVDLSPNRRLTGSKHEGLATYRELMNNVAIKTQPDGGALQSLLETWIGQLQSTAITSLNLQPGSSELGNEVQRQIYKVTERLQGFVNGFDFATVIAAYWRGHQEDNRQLTTSALRWLRGEYTTRTDARKDLGIRAIIDDNNWYEHIKLFAEFFVLAGFKGFVVFIDEAVNLYKISNRTGRENNYEKLLTILNDTLQGKAAHLGVIIGSTPTSITDARRGLFSYDALKTRLETSFAQRAGFINLSAPVIDLAPLTHDELFYLVSRLHDLHGQHYNYESKIGDEEFTHFLETELSRVGAETLITPRDILRNFVNVLDLLHQNPNATFADIISTEFRKDPLNVPDEESPHEEGADEDEGFSTVSI